MSHLRAAGVGWPNGPVNGGNHHILSLPSPDLLMLGSEHWHYGEAIGRGKDILFRGMARQGFRPAEVGWSPQRYVDEILRDARRIGLPNIKRFVAWNELNLQDERGDQRPDHGDLTSLYQLIGGFTEEVIKILRREMPGCELHYGAFAPKDECDYIGYWRPAAESCDVVDVHAYGPGPGIIGHIEKYDSLFPNHPIHLTEWHSDFGGPEMDRETLQLLANYAEAHQKFHAYYFMWKWHSPPSHQRDLADAIAIESNGSRMALFLNPPAATQEPVPPPEPPVVEPPMPQFDPWQYWTPADLAARIQCPLDAVTENWPRLCEQFGHVASQTGQEIFLSKDTLVALAATIAIETAHRFRPIHEFRMADGSIPAYWWTYDGGPEYHGRGFIQNTHRYNYADLGPKIAALWGAGPHDFDFVARPDDLLDPDISAAAAAVYFRDRSREDGDGIPEAAARGDWRAVRQLVQGADAGLSELISYATALGGVIVPPVDDTTAYSVNVPDEVVLQQNSWSCAVRSTYAALWAMAQVGQGEPVTYGDGGPRDVYEWMVPSIDSPGVGLHDGSGAQLAHMLQNKGYPAGYVYPCSIEQVRERAGKEPVLIGGGNWNHWVYVRGKHADGGLILENPSPGHGGITDYIRDSWDRLGPFAMVWIAPAVVADPPAMTPDYATLTALAYYEDGVVVPALAAALANPDDVNLRIQTDSVLRWLRENSPRG
jgi:hypothetical protein